MKKFLFVFIFLILFSFVDNINAYANIPLQGNINFTANKYILGPNDIIDVSFLGLPELENKNIRIQPDGNILLPTINKTINLAGKTIEEAQKEIENNSLDYLKRPIVSINLAQQKSFIVYITGAVLNPGSYELNTNNNKSQFISSLKPEAYIERKTPLLSNILVAAGGVSYDADLEKIEIYNSFTGQTKYINIFEMLENKHSNSDIYLTTGDKIHVPKLPTPFAINAQKYKKYICSTFAPKSIPVKVIGNVNNPGLIKLDSSQSANVNSAIAAAGGYFNDAPYAPRKIFLSRVDNNGKLITQRINPMRDDIALMPNDVIYIPEKLRPKIGKLFDYAVRAVIPFSEFSRSYKYWD